MLLTKIAPTTTLLPSSFLLLPHISWMVVVAGCYMMLLCALEYFFVCFGATFCALLRSRRDCCRLVIDCAIQEYMAQGWFLATTFFGSTEGTCLLYNGFLKDKIAKWKLGVWIKIPKSTFYCCVTWDKYPRLTPSPYEDWIFECHTFKDVVLQNYTCLITALQWQ